MTTKPKYDSTPCPISELPKYSCYDCVHDRHGRPADSSMEETMLRSVVGPATYTGQPDLPSERTSVSRVVEAQFDGTCDHPDCQTGKYKSPDKIIRTDEYGWVHARHIL